MRIPIQVETTAVDLDKYQSQIEAIRDAFSRYLEHYRPKSSASKHGLMGPVGKILREAKSGRGDPDYLKGYVLRAHESSQKSVPPPEAIDGVENGIQKLADLLRDLPVTAHDKVIDRLDYGLYFMLRKRFIHWLRERDDQYRSFLQNNYSDLDALSRAWNRDIKSWDSVRFGGPSSVTYKKASAKQREDMDQFTEHLRTTGKAEAVEIPEEEMA